MDEFVTVAQFKEYAKGINGSLMRIERKLDELTRQLEILMHRESDKRESDISEVHKRIDKVEKNNWPRAMTYLVSFLTATAVGAITALLAIIIKR